VPYVGKDRLYRANAFAVQRATSRAIDGVAHLIQNFMWAWLVFIKEHYLSKLYFLWVTNAQFAPFTGSTNVDGPCKTMTRVTVVHWLVVAAANGELASWADSDFTFLNLDYKTDSWVCSMNLDYKTDSWVCSR
jgi:hypothetical protein